MAYVPVMRFISVAAQTHFHFFVRDKAKFTVFTCHTLKFSFFVFWFIDKNPVKLSEHSTKHAKQPRALFSALDSLFITGIHRRVVKLVHVKEYPNGYD